MNEIAHQNGKIIHSPNAKLNWLSIFGLKVTKSVLWKIHIWLRLIARVLGPHESSGVWQNNSIPRLFTDYSHLRSQGRKYPDNVSSSESPVNICSHSTFVFPKLMNATYEMWFLVTRRWRGRADWSWPHIFHLWPPSRITQTAHPCERRVGLTRLDLNV